ncbi:MAG: Zn-ribbon domain-containing OB-fold protein [Candidatus Hodarchaeota archaeon]
MYLLEKFYNGLDEKVIYGTKCTKCGKVYFPPKVWCQDCLEKSNKLIELPQTGILKNHLNNINSNHSKKKTNKIDEIYGLVQIDMSDTPLIMPLFNVNTENIQDGMKVKVVWEESKKSDSLKIVGFEPIT